MNLSLCHDALHPPKSTTLIRRLTTPGLVTVGGINGSPFLNRIPPPPAIPDSHVNFGSLPASSSNVVHHGLLCINKRRRSCCSFKLQIIVTSTRGDSGPHPLSTSSGCLCLKSLPVQMLSNHRKNCRSMSDDNCRVLLHCHDHRHPTHRVSVDRLLDNRCSPA